MPRHTTAFFIKGFLKKGESIVCTLICRGGYAVPMSPTAKFDALSKRKADFIEPMEVLASHKAGRNRLEWSYEMKFKSNRTLHAAFDKMVAP